MASQRRPASRKSIAHLPTADNIDLASDDKENTPGDPETVLSAKSTTISSNTSQRKTRSKSIGPGSIDALKEDTANRRKISTAPPKSILKPSIPLSPLKEIPTRRHATPEPDSLLSSESPPKQRQSPVKADNKSFSPISPIKKASSPRRSELSTPSPSKTPTRTHSPNRSTFSQAESDDDEAKELRRVQREKIQKQREARRKSMANRRVSFAPEATLHTWDHLEDMQDSTTSSASTEMTQRASASAETDETSSSTLPEQFADDPSQSSSSNHRVLHQNQRGRRSSGIPPMNFNNPDDTFSSSPCSTTSASAEDATITGKILGDRRNSSPGFDSGSGKQSSSLIHPGTDQDRGQVTIHSVSNDSGQGVGEDENDGEMSMEIAADEITSAFRPFAEQASKPRLADKNFAINPGQENINPFSPAFRSGISLSPRQTGDSIQNDNNDDMSMDMTRVIGGIVVHGAKTSPKREQSVRPRRRSSGGSSAPEDHTMDFTAAIGGIQSNRSATVDAQRPQQQDQNEELSMEFTSVFGGIQNKNSRSGFRGKDAPHSEYTDQQPLMDELHASNEGDVNNSGYVGQDEDIEMDMTKAVGRIVSIASPAQEFEVSGKKPQPIYQAAHMKSSSKHATPSPTRPSVSTSATGSPAITRSLQLQSIGGTPRKSPQTPSKQVTPQPARPTTPEKTPPSKNITMRHPSPRQLFRQEIYQTRSSPVPDQSKLFSQDAESGHFTPKIVLAPASRPLRRTSGVGFDKEGLGSPRVAALLDRRTSIGEQADVFMPQAYASREVRFQDPRVLEAEVTREREDDGRRESGQFIIETEAGAELDDKDVTTSLKQAIGSMSPKKTKSKPRKSLAVGAAKGLLGKRPIELDEDDEDPSPQGLRGRETSPVKKIKLQAPPSASETTGRSLTLRKSLGAIAGNDRPRTPMMNSPIKILAVTTPSHRGHFKDAEALPSAKKPFPILGQSEPSDEVELIQVDNEDHIRLQDFLNMTNIRFMELNTTKRRHTVAPDAERRHTHFDNGEKSDPSRALEDAVVAGACTLPMLELYQHSCRELKKYISEGRKIVREIEANTYEDNPALFQEYMSASPSNRAVMDNQFKNMKTHARLVSKGMWYEWRMKLLEGLRGVLVNETEGLDHDSRQLESEENAIVMILPSMVEKRDNLNQERALLQERANELADCNQDELKEARQHILSIDEQLSQRRERIAMLRTQSEELDAAIEDVMDVKAETLEAIKEAKRVHEEYRGWSASEVSKLKRNVDLVESEHGWTILTASYSQLTLVFKGQLQLFFDVASFLPGSALNHLPRKESGPISLSYVGDSIDYRPLPLTTEKRFILQLMRAHLQCLEQGEMRVKDLLDFVSAGWMQALAIADEIRRMDLENITECSILGDERLAVLSMILLPAVKTKIKVVFEVGVSVDAKELRVKLKPKADVVYGEEYRGDKMKNFLMTKIGEGVDHLGNLAYAVRELKKKLVAQGPK